MRIRSPQDLGAAIVFLAIGAAALAFRGDLEVGDAAKMGPAYFPTILGWLILGIGVILAVRSLRFDGPPIERVQLRPLLLIVASVVLFGFLLESVGLVIATIVVTLVSVCARPKPKWKESLALGVGLSVFAAVVFVWALSQPLPLGWWPQ
jgi:putative tricarboxylic transport membrane protein